MCVHGSCIALLYAAVYSGVIEKYGKPYLLYLSDGYVARYAMLQARIAFMRRSLSVFIPYQLSLPSG
jgi:hypothetical protein